MNCAGQPHDFWQKNREMVSFKDACVQLWGPLAGTTGEVGEVVGNEDCLYLNIWAPQNNSDIDSTGLPVMFWIHGGGNSIGTANTYSGHSLCRWRKRGACYHQLSFGIAGLDESSSAAW